MAVTKGTFNPTSTPATAMYNILAAAMTAAATGWAFVETVALATAGTTADVKVWRANTSPDLYLAFEVDDVNNRIRVRASESYNATTHKLVRPVHGGTGSTSYTPSADYSAPGGVGTEFTINTATTVGYVEIPVSPGGISYMYKVWDQRVFFSTKTGTASPNFCLAGNMTTLVDTVPDVNCLFLVCAHVNPSWPVNGGNARSSREPNSAVATTGAFCYVTDVIYPTGALASSTPTAAKMGAHQSGSTHKGFGGFVVSPAVLHGTDDSTNQTFVTGRALRAYIPDFVVFEDSNTNIEAQHGETVQVGGVSYYIVGRSTPTAITHRSATMAVRAGA